MQYSLAHLPKETRDELIQIRDDIKLSVPETMYIILFGSYAKGTYVSYDQRTEYGVRTYFMSDYDILVVTTDEADQFTILSRLQTLSTIHYNKSVDYSRTPTIQFLIDTQDSFISAVEDGRYFYSDIYKEGILLYAKKELVFDENKELSPTQKSNLATEYFNHRFGRGNSFLRSANHDFKDGDYNMASFHLHQAVENYLLAIILTSSLYSPKEHNIFRLLEIASRYTDVIKDIFPITTLTDKRVLQLLEDAYIDGRFNPNFDVSRDDIAGLLKKSINSKGLPGSIAATESKIIKVIPINNVSMKKSLAHLPKEKKKDIKEIVRLIVQEVPETLMVILIGSYATGKYVEYDQRVDFGVRTTYISDYDFMVITPKKNKKSHESIMHRLMNAREKYNVDKLALARTPVQFMNETLEDFNKKITQGRYFYTDIKKLGILLFNADPNTYKLARIKKLNFVQIRDLAVEYYNDKYSKASEFLIDATNSYNRNSFVQSSFYLHQATENYLTTIVLTSSLYTPKKHDLKEIIDETKLFTTVAVDIFPEYNTEKDRLFQLLYNAYLQARYNRKFQVTREDIDELMVKINELKDKTKEVCEEKIREYNARIDKHPKRGKAD